jgi:hypothetical protein
VRVEQFLSEPLYSLPALALFDVTIDRTKTGDDSLDIPVDRRDSIPDGNADNSSCGIGPNPRKLLPAANLGRKTAIGDNLTRCGMKKAGSSVIPQPRPVHQDIVYRCSRKIFNSWEALDESLEIGNNPVYLGLLEHDLRDPYRIWILRSPPRQIAPVLIEPGKEGPGQIIGRSQRLFHPAAHKRFSNWLAPEG